MHTTPSRTPTKSASMLSALTSRAASFFNDTEHLPAPPPRPAVPRSFSDHLITRRRPVMAPSPLAHSSSFSALEAMQSRSTESQSSYSDDSSSSASSECNSSPPTSPHPSHPKQQQTAIYGTLALKRCDSTVHTVNAAHDVVVQTSPHSADFGQSAIVGVWEEPSQSPVQYRWTVTDYCQVDDGQWRRDESQGQRGQSQPRLQWEASEGRDASPTLSRENEDRGRTLSAVEETKERGRTLARRSASPGARLMAKFAKKWRRVDGSV